MTVQVAQAQPGPLPDAQAGAAAPDALLGADDAELKAAEADLEKAGQSLDAVAGPDNQDTAAAAETAPPGAETVAAAEPGETIRIPKAEFDKRMRASRVREQEARELAAYWKGKAEGGTTQPNAGQDQPQTATEPATYDEAIQQIETKQVQLAQDLEDNKLSTAEWRKKDLALTRERENLVSERATVHAVERSKPDPVNDINVVGFTRQLETEKPWVQNVPEQDWAKLRPWADEIAQANGLVIDMSNQGTVNLRACLVAAAEAMNLDTSRYGHKPDPAQAGTQQTRGAAPAGPGATPAQVKAKIVLQGQQPPAPLAVGQAKAGIEEWTEDRLSKMKGDDLANLPPAVLERLGIKL